MEKRDDENIYAMVEELPMNNIVYDDVHTTTTDISMISRGNICYDNPHAMAAELPISKSDICYDQVPKPSANITTSRITRDGRRGYKTILILIIAVIILILSATCAGTVYTLVQLSRLNIASATSHTVDRQQQCIA